MMILLATVSTATAEDAPSMWMEQMPDGDIELFVNTSEESSGAYARIFFDPTCINITNLDFTGSPWQPLTGIGWSHQGDYVILSLIEFDGVAAGEYKIAEMDVVGIGGDCTSEINITNAEPLGVVAYNMTYTYNEPAGEAIISIGSGSGDVIIPIMISNCENVGAVDITLNFDPTVVSVVGVTDGSMDCTYTNLEHADEGWVRVGAIQGDNPGLNSEYPLLNVEFAPVINGGSCPLELVVTTFKDANPDCVAMDYIIVNGVYSAPINGDVNGDGVLDIVDASYIAKYVIGMVGYETIDEDAAEVTGDGIIDMADSMYLTKHVMGVVGFEDLR